MIKSLIPKYLIAILFCLLFVQNNQAQAIYQDKIETIVDYSANNKIFPCKWRKKRMAAIATPIPEKEIIRTNESLLKAITKYPFSMIEKNLRKIYAMRTLSFFDLDYGGTYYRRCVYITNDGIEKGYTVKVIEGSFHHEFSSVLIKRYKKAFKKSEWMAANPLNFTYGDGGKEALKSNKSSKRPDASLYPSGFLNEYSLASIEEDFNCYAELLFMSDDDFWIAWETSEAVRKKTNILISFYHRINAVFTLEYFRGLTDR